MFVIPELSMMKTKQHGQLYIVKSGTTGTGSICKWLTVEKRNHFCRYTSSTRKIMLLGR